MSKDQTLPAADAEKKPFLVGYARVSMSDQSNERQRAELIRHGVSPLDIWEDHASGKNMKRPGWEGLWKDIREGDVVVVHALDRLGRDVLQILQTLEGMNARGVGLRVLSGGGIDTSTPIGRFVFTTMAAFAQLERELIVERTAHGLAKARERGVIGGRPEKVTQAMVLDAIKRVDRRPKGETVKDIAVEFKVAPVTLQRRMEAHRKAARIKGREG